MSALTNLFSNIADAIRTKKGTSEDIIASNFPSEILSIPTVISDSYFKDFMAPTTWSSTLGYTQYTGSNGYGTWNVQSDSSDGSTHIASYAFDGSTSTSWRSDDIERGTSAGVKLTFPILIKPTELTIASVTPGSGNNPYSIDIQLQDTEDAWETLWTTTQQGGYTSQSVSTNKWYKGIRAVGTRPSGQSGSQVIIAELKVSKGYWKEMT